jgi:hypothetical protein
MQEKEPSVTTQGRQKALSKIWLKVLFRKLLSFIGQRHITQMDSSWTQNYTSSEWFYSR